MEFLLSLVSSVSESYHVVFTTLGLKLCVFMFFGAVIGSFLNVVIYRLPNMLRNAALLDTAEYYPKLVSDKDVLLNVSSVNLGGFSIAPCCHTPIKWYHNIPVLSWPFLRGKCAYCGDRIATRYVLVELLVSLIFTVIAFLVTDPWSAVILCALASVLVAIAFIDIDTQIIPDSLQFALFVLSLLAFDAGALPSHSSLSLALSDAGLTYVLLYGLNLFHDRFRGEIAFGGGDIKLLAIAAMGMGVDLVMQLLALAVFVNYLYCLVKKAQGEVALGQFISGFYGLYVLWPFVSSIL